jgi:hypothetical protein
MSEYANIPLKPLFQGDTWDGMTISLATAGNALDSDLALVEMSFSTAAGVLGLYLSSATTGQITITDAGAWAFTIPKQALALAPGKWFWSITCTNAAGDIKTRMIGTKEILKKP